MTDSGVRETLDVGQAETLALDLADKIYGMQLAQQAMRDYQLERARDEGFEYGVLATENGLGRA